MKIIRPLAITDAVLISSNVPEDDYPAFAAGATYALGARVVVIGPDVHLVYESLQAGNVGHVPAASLDYWVKVGPTNRWRMFDRSITSQAENPDSISVALATTGITNGVALLNIDCTGIHVQAVDATLGVVYEKTINPALNSGITDLYSYFTEPITRITEMALTDLPAYSNMRLNITLSNAGRTVRCGGLVVGLVRNMGDLQYGAKIGTANYSPKIRDQFGDYDVIEGAFSNKATWSLWIESRDVDLIKRLLTQYRATPIVYIGAEMYGATIVYGFYKDFSIDISYPTYSVCSLELEGLT